MTAHSRHGMSGQSRIIACPGSVNMQRPFPNETNDAAEKGTAVHELAEFCLIWQLQCSMLIGSKFNNFKIDEQMAWAGQIYADYVRQILKQRPNANIKLECRVVISSIDEKKLYGTADCIIIDLENRTLIIGDYKNGFGVVEVDKPQYVHVHNDYVYGNAQCVGYGLGALDTFDLWDKVDKVITFISQPNVEHTDGLCRYKIYLMDEINKWWLVYKDTHHLSLKSNAPLNPGPHCRYCLSRGNCGPRIRHNLQTLGLDQPLDQCTPEQLVSVMLETNAIKASLDAVYNQCVTLAREGIKVPGHKLVQGIRRAVCTDENEFVKAMVDAGYKEGEVTNSKPKSKTDLNRVLKGDDKKLIDKYYQTPEGGLTLVPMSDKRPAQMADGKAPSCADKFQPVN